MRIAIPLLVLAIACGKKDDTSKGAPTDKPVAGKPAEPGAPSPSAEAPGCKLSITGAETRTVEGENNAGAVTTNYWFKPGDENIASMWPGDAAGLIMNCTGPRVSLSITTSDATKSTLALGPHKFVLGDDAATSLVSVLGAIESKSIVKPKGTVELTAFDTTHVAGKIDLTAKLIPGDGDLKIVGEFHFNCFGLSGCGQ